MAIRHARVPAGTDFGPVLAGLPDHRCPSPHWGNVLEGSIHLQHADGTVGPMREFHDHARSVFAGSA